MNNPMSRCPFWAQKNHLGLSRSPSEVKFRDLATGTPPGPQNPAKKFKNPKKSNRQKWVIVPLSDRSFLKSSRAFPDPHAPEFRDLATGTPPGP